MNRTFEDDANYWSLPHEVLFDQLQATPQGLTVDEARNRLERFGLNTLKRKQRYSPYLLFVRQFRDPLVLILFFAVCVSIVVNEWVDATVVTIIIIGSSILTFTQEYRANRAVEKLLARVQTTSTVLRDGKQTNIPTDQVVPGEIVLLSAGNLIPGDGVVLQSKACYVDQAALTGETFPVEKNKTMVQEGAALAERTNCVFMGTSMRSGTAKVLIVQTGANTIYGKIAERLTLHPPETEFERGIRQFGYLLTQIVFVFVLVVFAFNVFSAKPAVDSFLFAVALAVGMAPELLPAVVTITLSSGAQQMASHGVIVRRLNAIENFGIMDVLCTDKTGTLTQGSIHLSGVFDVNGEPSEELVFYAYLNAYFQEGIHNPLDEAIISTTAEQWHSRAAAYHKLDEIPYDFNRKRLSVIVTTDDETGLLITKGAFKNVLNVCDRFQDGENITTLDVFQCEHIQRLFDNWSAQGFRVLGVATKPVLYQSTFSALDEQDLVFRGFLLFYDPPKEDVQATLADLAQLCIELKIITGDNLQVSCHVAQEVGLAVMNTLTGSQINELRDEALWHIAEHTSIFAEVDPNQKERIIRALQKTGHVVGYMGDGINDAPALHVADVGISVDQAVDVAKEAADFVLLEHNLRALHDGVINGRKTFANTLKYIFTTTSANFGNMFTMAGLSAVLPFLPLLAKQILLNNFLSDIPGMAIANDNVDQDMIEKPHRWNMRFIRSFMIVFGLVSSVFDYVTVALLMWVVQASPPEFRTAWFIESLMTELAIALVVRSRKPFFRSKPGKWLFLSTLAVAILTLLIPYLPVNTVFDFVPLPIPLMLMLLMITLLYVATAEIAKHFFYQNLKGSYGYVK